jgi:hypothetical protein
MGLTERGRWAGTAVDERGKRVFSTAVTERGKRVFGLSTGIGTNEILYGTATSFSQASGSLTVSHSLTVL